MYRDDPISQDEHQRWFQNILEDSASSRVRILESDSQASGLASLTKIDLRNRSCEWGGYLAPEIDRGGGVGRAMLFLSLEHAFEELDLNRVAVEVIVGNDAAIKLYESIGFLQEGLLRERAFRRSGPVDALILAMLRSEWTENKKENKKGLVARGLLTER
jgi:UDP-4-amino-4,6-dideoxy-N-acetyl-beta-L-altrosamine N-acetyltransferase